LLTSDVDGGTFHLRRATLGDLPAAGPLLADDALGAGREAGEDMAPYERAFEAITPTRPTCWWWGSWCHRAKHPFAD